MKPGGVGDRVAQHVHGHHRDTLVGGQPHQRLLHHNRGVGARRWIAHWHRVVLKLYGDVSSVAPQPI